MPRFLAVCLGGAVGTGARYLLNGWFLRWLGPAFPWGTLAINVLGSFLLTLILTFALASDAIPLTLRIALTTGVLGGFTTYSTFNHETLQYLLEQKWLLAGLYLGGTVLGCLLASLLGLACGRALAAS